MFVDGAHNEAAMMHSLLTLRERFPNKQWCILLGVSQDKNVSHIVLRKCFHFFKESAFEEVEC